MAKYKTLNEYINTFNEQALTCYKELQEIISEVPYDVKERLFAGQVAFYIEETLKRTFHESPVIVMSFYKDHVNIFANSNVKYKSQLESYTFTEKGTLQIHYNKRIERDILLQLFKDSLR